MLCLQGRPGWHAPGLRGLGRRSVRFSVNLGFGEREVGSRPLGEVMTAEALGACGSSQLKDVRTRALWGLPAIYVTLRRNPGSLSQPLWQWLLSWCLVSPKTGAPRGGGQGRVWGARARPRPLQALARGACAGPWWGAPCCTGRGVGLAFSPPPNCLR